MHLIADTKTRVEALLAQVVTFAKENESRNREFDFKDQVDASEFSELVSAMRDQVQP